MRRFATLMVALMLVVGIISAAALTGSSSDDPSGSQTERPAATPAESRTASPAASIQRIDSLAYGEPESGSPTNRTGQSRLWFHDDTWWGVLLVAESGDHRIHRLDAAAGQWVDLGVIVDDRVFARMDVLWDGEHLVVASAGTQPDDRHALRIVRYT
ncbi:MAG TPA: hypothetical protein VHG52_04895, partial [Thermomicrobiales bacterium]|nr:hypothetical protein [Thermomicrobiales bacterium]